ncbi:MAG TPA: hydroxyacid dehydrogenase [Thermotogota bacterium]|nr:hydroxyacid dehydrogenase [Thermotogota bacterium]HRW92838.1 hydroxyacid dehydrogenase [Thermotogota bacterium]
MGFKVHVNDPLDKKATARLEAIKGVQVTAEHFEPEELKQRLGEYDVLVIRSATKAKRDIIEAGTNLKIIARAGTGLDNVDTVAAAEKGIMVINTPGANAISVAELAIGLLLGLFRHIPRGTAGIKEGKWEKKALKGHEIFGKTVGVVGFGAIGREVARRLLAFGCNILAYDVVQDAAGLDVQFVSLEELYSRADILTFHTPLIDATRHIFNHDSLEHLKPGVFVVHAARGGVVNEQALFDGLQSGKIAGAALDVFEVEPPTDELRQKLIALDNVIATPHVGASTSEAQARVGMDIVERLEKALQSL